MNNITLSNYTSHSPIIRNNHHDSIQFLEDNLSMYLHSKHANALTDTQFIQSFIKSKNKYNSFLINQQDEILTHEIQELITRGNSIFLYNDHMLIPLNPKDDDILTNIISSSSLLHSNDKGFDKNNKEKIVKNTILKKKLKEYFSKPFISKQLVDINPLNKKSSDSPNIEMYDEHKLWVVTSDSPSQSLHLNKFIIEHFYEKKEEIHQNQSSYSKEVYKDQSKNKKIFNDILLLIKKFVISMNSLVFWSLLISCYIVNKLKYDLDLSQKLQYLTNRHYVQESSNLAILSLKNDNLCHLCHASDFDSPIEKAIGIINQLINQTEQDSPNYELLNNALVYLNSSNLLLPDLERQLQGFVELEDEQKQWLLYEIAQQNNNYYDDSDNNSEYSHYSVPSPYAFYELSSIDILSLIDCSTFKLLEKVTDYNFPIFDFCEATPRPLLTMSYHLFVKSGLISRLHLNTEKFLNFIKEVEEGYHTDVTFHNAYHVTDVLHCMYYFTTIPNIGVNFKDWDLLMMFVAACIHDYDHPGLSNKFLIQTGDPLAILYNDKSVLENHHCAMSFSILFKEQNNFLEHLDKEKFNDFRETIISLVLATDLAEHFQILSLFKKKILNIPKCVQREDKILLMKILIKCADISNATKERSLYKRWVEGIMEEFYRQGDREKELNIPLTPFGNRDCPKPNSCQKSFVEFLASPIFEVLAEWVYTCQSKPDPEEYPKSPTKLDTHNSVSSTKSSTNSNKRNSISGYNVISNDNTNSIQSINEEDTNETNNNNNNTLSATLKPNRRSSLCPMKIGENCETSFNEFHSTTNNHSLSTPPSPTLHEHPLQGKKLSIGSIFKTDLPNRFKSGIKSRESAINLMMKHERDFESRRKMDVIINGLQKNRKWVEANGLGA